MYVFKEIIWGFQQITYIDMDTDEFYYICGFQEGGYASHSILVYVDMYYGPSM